MIVQSELRSEFATILPSVPIVSSVGDIKWKFFLFSLKNAPKFSKANFTFMLDAVKAN